MDTDQAQRCGSGRRMPRARTSRRSGRTSPSRRRPDRHQQRRQHPAAARAARPLPSLVPEYENVHRGQSQRLADARPSGSRRPTTRSRPGSNAPSRRTHRRCTATRPRRINAVMYSLLTEFRDGDNVVTTTDGAQLQLRALVRAVPRDPAPVRPPGGVPARALRPRHRRARPGASGVAGRLPDQARLLHRRVELPRHQDHPLRSVRQICRRERLRPARRRAAARYCWWTAPSWCPSSFVDVRRSTSTTWRSRSTRCSRRSASACCTPRSSCSQASLPFLYGGDMIAEGQVSADRVDYNALPWKYAAGTPEHPRHDRLRAGAAPRCSTWRSTAERRATSAPPADRAGRRGRDGPGRGPGTAS